MTPSVKLLSFTTPAVVTTDLWVCRTQDGTDAGVFPALDPATPGIDESLDLIEYAGRWDYGAKSLAKMGDRDIIRRWIASGHLSMLEMVDATFLVECSRVVSHELVRHRLASFQQESQRYVSYLDEDMEELFYVPEAWQGNEEAAEAFEHAYAIAKGVYRRLIELGVPKQEARYVLPNATRTRIVVKANLREWRHILALRAHSSAQPEMQVIAQAILGELNELFPEVFADVVRDVEEGKRAVR